MAEFEHPIFSKRGPATLSKDVYSDVSNVPPKSSRIEVYADIFSDFYARKPLSSIPFLDFADSDFADNLPFDYSDVFGGSNGVDFGISCDEVLAAESKWAEHPSAEFWTPTEKYSHWKKPAVSKECNTDILAHSEKNGFLSNGASHCYDGGQQFNVSCNKTKQGAKDYSMTAIKHIDKLHEVSGFTYAVDALSPSHMTRCYKCLTEAIGDPVLNEYSCGAIADGNHFKDATLHTPAFRSVTKTYKNDHKENTRQLESDALPCEQHHIQYCGCLSPYGNRSSPEKVLLSVSEITLQTQPSQVPPPSRSPPKVVLRNGECKGMTSMNMRASPDEDHMTKTLTKSRSYLQRIFSETHALEDALMDSSLPCIKVEEYDTSAAASSAAAMEKTEAWIRIAKQSMERKQSNFQNQRRLSVNEDEKVKARREGKTAQEDKKTKDVNQEIDQREKCVEDNFVGDKKCKGTRVAYIGPDLGYTTLAKESSSQWKRKGSKVTMESHKQEERAGEDQAEKSFVPAKDKYKMDQEVPAKANEHKVNARQAFEETVGLEEKEKLCTQKEAYEWEEYCRSFEVTTKDADDWEEREKKSKTPYKHEENEKKSMACEWEEIEKKLKSAQEVRKLEQNEKKRKEAKEAGGHEENENKLKAAKASHEQEENVNLKISQEVCEWVDKDLLLKAAVEKRIQATCITAEEDENAKLKAAQEAHLEWKESEKVVQEAHEIEENEKSFKAAQKACKQDENDKRITAAREANKKEENEERLKAAEACESEENEKRLKAVQEALAWEENDNRIQAAQEAHHQEENENGLKALQDACKWEENERKLKEAQETSRGEENEKKLSAAEEAREREEHEKLKATQEAHEWEQNDKRLKVGQKSTEQEEEKKQLRAVQAALGHEEIVNEWNKVQEAFGRAENEMKLKPASEAYKQERNLGEMEVAHGHDNEVGKQLKAAKEVREIEDCKTPEAAKLVYKQEESKNNFKAAREAYVQGKFELAGSENRLKAAQDMYELEEFKKKPKGAHDPCKQDGNKKLAAFQLAVSQDETEKKEVIGDGHELEEYGKQLITTLEVHEYEKNEKKVNVDEVVLEDGAKEKLRETKEPCGWEDDERNTEASQFSRAEQIKQNQIVANEANGVGENENGIREADVALDWEENKNQSKTDRAVIQWLENARKFKAAQAHVLEEKETRRDPVIAPIQGAERKEKNANDGSKLDLERGKLQRERELEMKQTRKIQEEGERERKREKDGISVERATREARNRTFTEAPERVAVKRATAEARQRAMAEARERAEKASAEAHEKSLAAKDSMEVRFRADHAAVESATAEVRVRAAELASSQAGEAGGRMRQSSSFSDIRLGSQILAEGESPKRCKARFERHLRTVERAAKALAEKNLRDILSQKEQAERNRLAETLDADVRRWSNGKEGNLRALLSTLQYILGRESGWQPIPLTDVITAVAVKRAYRKATLCVHPDKVQQRGASIQEKYICGKVFDLLKEAWNNFNSDA